MNWIKKYWWIAILIIVLVSTIFVAWASDASSPQPEALSALNSTELVEVSSLEKWIIFQPTGKKASTGLIIYPGGKVDARSYAPLAKEIANAGYTVVILPMPLNLAVFAPNSAEKVIEQFPSISNWAIAGHSLGGSMAATFVNNQPNRVDGIAFWASYPIESSALDDQPIEAVSIYGTNDGLATLQDIENSRPFLPADTTWVPIEGGNHAQFGWYGPQNGDNPATVSHLAQQSQIVTATIALLEKISATS